MSKLIQVKIKRIKYGGDSVGDDIKLEAVCLDKFFSFSKQLKCGSETDLDIDIGTFFSDNKTFNLPLELKIIEQDLIFNDVGNKSLNLKIDLSTNVKKTEICKIEVQELHNFISKNKAIFDITIVIEVTDTILFIDYSGDGWIKVLDKESGRKISLPCYLKVQLKNHDNDRQYFKILEGGYKNKLASIKFKKNNQSYLLGKNPQINQASIIYSISKKIVQFNNKIYKVTDYPDNPWNEGVYDIEIPDAPHESGRYYSKAKLAKTWFRIGHSGERYFHPGTRSLGCITLTEIEKWDELCKILLKSRKGDGISVGTLKIVD